MKDNRKIRQRRYTGNSEWNTNGQKHVKKNIHLLPPFMGVDCTLIIVLENNLTMHIKCFKNVQTLWPNYSTFGGLSLRK